MKKYFLTLLIFVFSFCMTTSVSANNLDTYIVIDIEIENQITGDKTSQNESFFFEIEATDSGYPLPESSTVTILGEGTTTFENFMFTKTGVYVYHIYQLIGDNADYTYDETVFEVTIYITNNSDGGYDSTVHVKKIDTELKSASVTFSNIYNSSTATPEPTEPSDTDTDEDSPETGDTSRTSMLVAVIILSLSVIIILVIKQKKS